MFTVLIVQPIFNLLVFIYAIIPGHDFGLSIILFTILIRVLMWPLVKKQLHHTKKLRELQPELKKIKADAKGDRQKESQMTMELYKERKVSPFATIGFTLLQFPILIGLYIGLQKVINDPQQLVDFSYPFIRDMSWMKQLAADPSLFDPTFFGIVNLDQAAFKNGVWYIPALILVFGSAVTQYLQSKQLMPSPKDAKSLRQILRDASSGKKADQSEMQAATGRYTSLLIPVLIFFVTLGIASALSLYWFVSGIIAFLQQSFVLKEDKTELEAVADAPVKKKVIEGEVIEKKAKSKTQTKKSAAARKGKRRKR